MRGLKIILGLGVTILGGYGLYKIIGKEPVKYSLEWIKGLSDIQWENERQIIQDQYRNPKYDIPFRENCKRILELFDKVKSDKDWAGRKPQGPSYHREHGYGLFKKDN